MWLLYRPSFGGAAATVLSIVDVDPDALSSSLNWLLILILVTVRGMKLFPRQSQSMGKKPVHPPSTWMRENSCFCCSSTIEV
jgi:hypothetical protein